LSHSTRPTSIGKNRTGIATALVRSGAVVEAASEDPLVTDAESSKLLPLRTSFARAADPVGTMPPPASLKGMAKNLVEKLRGRNPMVLLDKMGERLAFERTGVRLYEAMLAKYEASDAKDPTITMSALLEIRDDELVHVGLLGEAIQQLGGDPTVVTPCADLVGVIGSGYVQVLTDPRTTLTQALDVMLAIELADNASWELLIELAGGMGLDTTAADFQHALVDEQRHLMQLRSWVSTQLVGQAGLTEEVTAAPIL
jgi:hypothetical protein